MANYPTIPDISGLDIEGMLYKLYDGLYNCLKKVSSYTPPEINPDDPAYQNAQGELDSDKVANKLNEYSDLVKRNMAFGMAESITNVVMPMLSIKVILPFNGCIDYTGSIIAHPAPDSIGTRIFFEQTRKRFLCCVGTNYYAQWSGSEDYMLQTENGLVPNNNAIFVNGNIPYWWNGTEFIQLWLGGV